MRPERLLILNCIIVLVSFAIVWFYDWPLEALGAIGLAWVVISSISLINALKRRDKQFDPVISMELLEHTHEQGEEPDEEE